MAKAQAEARSAGASAETAEATARTAVAKALVGEIPAAPYTGAVTTTETAALAEHNHLARQALMRVAGSIASNAGALVGSNIFITADDAGPPRAAAEAFVLHSQLVEQALDGAVGVSEQLDRGRRPPKNMHRDAIPILTALPLVLSGLNAALSYARSDHSLSGREFQPGDCTLISAVAHDLIRAGKTVRVDGPAMPVPESIQRTLIEELAALSKLASDARARAGHHAAVIQSLSPKPIAQPVGGKTDNAPAPADPDPDNQRPLHEEALGALKAAVKLFDELEGSLLAVSDGTSGVLRIARARALASFFDEKDSAILVVKLDGVFGSTVSSKNLLKSVFGEMPYKLSVQVQANWRCFDANNLTLRGSGLKASHIGFTEIEKIGSHA